MDDALLYKEQMKSIQDALDSVDTNIRFIADRLGNGAVLSYPNESRNPDLQEVYDRLVDQSERLIAMKVQLHATFNKD